MTKPVSPVMSALVKGRIGPTRFRYLVDHNPFQKRWNFPALLESRMRWLEETCGPQLQPDTLDGLWFRTASNHFRFEHAGHALAFARHFSGAARGHIIVVPVDENHSAAAWASAELGPAMEQTWLMQSSVLWFASEPHAIECALRFR